MSVPYLAGGGTGGGLAGTVADYATAIMDVLGSPGAGLANALDSIIPVLPSEVILPLAGFAASRGSINLVAALIWTTIGSIAGSLAMYYLGAAFGRDRVRAWAAKIPLVKVSEIDRTEAWFARHGTKTVFLGRMVPVFRSMISIPAGIEHMPLVKFVGFTALGSAIWNTIFVMAGYLLGNNWEKVEQYGSIFSKVIIGLIVLAVGYFVVSRLIRRRRDDGADPTGPGTVAPGAAPPEPALVRPMDGGATGAAPASPLPGMAPRAAAPGAAVPGGAAPRGAAPAGAAPGGAAPGGAAPGGRRYAGTVYGTPRRAGAPADHPPRRGT